MFRPRYSKVQDITILGTTLAAVSVIFTGSLFVCSWLGFRHPCEGNPGVFFLLMPLVPLSSVIVLWGVVVLLRTSCTLHARTAMLILNIAGLSCSMLLGYLILKLLMLGPINPQ